MTNKTDHSEWPYPSKDAAKTAAKTAAEEVRRVLQRYDVELEINWSNGCTEIVAYYGNHADDSVGIEI